MLTEKHKQVKTASCTNNSWFTICNQQCSSFYAIFYPHTIGYVSCCCKAYRFGELERNMDLFALAAAGTK
jgi:hypothetical protein